MNPKDYFRLVGKCLASAVLLAALLFSVALSLALVPMLIAKNHSKGTAVLMDLVPMGILAGLLWRLWSPPRMDGYEELRAAYNEGMAVGKKTAKPSGKIAR